MVNTMKNHLLGTTTLLLVLSSILPQASRAEDCFDGEEEVEFTLFLDADAPQENGWSMQCNKTVVWDVDIGTLETTLYGPAGRSSVGGRTRMRRHHPFVRDTACVPEDATCYFTIEDSEGNGLEWPPGYYVLKRGGLTVAYYDKQPFYENAYCFGPDCPQVPAEVAQDYDDLYFYLRLDANPEETAFTIDCEGDIILEGSNYVTNFTEIEIETKVEPYICCRLTIVDSGQDGLTEQGEDFGDGNVVYLDWAGYEVISYGSDVEFGMISIDFGMGC